MATKKYVSLSKLQTFLDKLKDTFASLSHTHKIADLTDYTVDSALSSTSTNPVQNKVLDAEFDSVATAMGALEQAIDGKSDSSHTHDDRYYTESEVDTLVNKVKEYVDDAVNVPSFDLATLGLGSIPLTGEAVTLTTDTSAIRTAMDAGAIEIKVKFNIGIDLNGTATVVPLYLAESNEYQAVINTVVQGTPVMASFTFTTTEIIARAVSLVSKSDHEWTQIYDSGEITESINAFANIDISGYKKLRVVVKCVNDGTNSTAKHGAVTFTASNGTTYQFNIWSTLFANTNYTTGAMATFEISDSWLICPNATRILKSSNFLGTEGGVADNLNNTGSGIMKCTNELSTMMVSSTDQDVNYYFLAGSRVLVWGCKA